MSELLELVGLDATVFPSAEIALSEGDLSAFDVALLDVQMSGVNGLDLQERMRELGFQTPVIFVTSWASDATRKRAMAGGASALLPKPFDSDALIAALQAVLGERWRPT